MHITYWFIVSSLFTTYLFAQPIKISGHVYELVSGAPIEDVRINIKNRQGIDIARLPPVYSNSNGYFEFSPVSENDYRIEITHTFETPTGPVGSRLFTNSQVLRVEASDYRLVVALAAPRFERIGHPSYKRKTFMDGIRMKRQIPHQGWATASQDPNWHWHWQSSTQKSRIVSIDQGEFQFIESVRRLDIGQFPR